MSSGFVFVFLIFGETKHIFEQGKAEIDDGVKTETQRRDWAVLFIGVS